VVDEGGHNPRLIQLIMTLRRQGITDRRVLGAIETVPREAFVPPAFAEHAYENSALPIEGGQTISQPFVVAYMTEQLRVGPRDKVLEIGTGSGYQAAILAALCRRVYTVERHRALLRAAERRFNQLGLHNVTTRFGDGAKGWPEQAPFDRIMVTAGTSDVPQALMDQLRPGGVLIAPINIGTESETLVRLTKGESPDTAQTEDLGPVRFVPLLDGTVSDD